MSHFEDLFAFGAARATDPETSIDAARKLCAAPLCQAVLKALRERPMSVEEIAAVVGAEIVSVSPRTKPLETAGYLRRTEEKRRGASGRWRIVWALTEAGRGLL